MQRYGMAGKSTLDRAEGYRAFNLRFDVEVPLHGR
jgi:hypothetical protein